MEEPDSAAVEILKLGLRQDEAALEGALRPTDLDQFIGQDRVRDQLKLILDAALGRRASAEHILLSGPPGLGKTTLAAIVAKELGAPMRVTSGPAIAHAGDLAAVLSSLEPGEILFIDEIHRLARPAEEMLYLAMEDFRVDVVVGKGVGANAISLDLPNFTLIGATTRAGLLPSPLRDRFGFTAYLDFYPDNELEQIVLRSAKLLDIQIDSTSAKEISRRSRGTPRIANRLLRRVRDFAQVHASGNITLESSEAALKLFEIDEHGLDRIDRAILQALITKFGGGPVGLSTLAMAIGEEADIVEQMAEPYLVRSGYLARSNRGRVATLLAYQVLGKTPPQNLNRQESLDLF
ncbi:MAG: Holliday junction ATP-dependent helicase RuvB [Actinomycetota bacterium]